MEKVNMPTNVYWLHSDGGGLFSAGADAGDAMDWGGRPDCIIVDDLYFREYLKLVNQPTRFRRIAETERVELGLPGDGDKWDPVAEYSYVDMRKLKRYRRRAARRTRGR